MALAYGFSTRSDLGWAGEAPVRAARLVDAEVTRKALTRTEDANLVIIIDERLFREVVTEELRGLRPHAWTPVRAQAKNFDEPAYLYVPAHARGVPGSKNSWAIEGDAPGVRSEAESWLSSRRLVLAGACIVVATAALMMLLGNQFPSARAPEPVRHAAQHQHAPTPTPTPKGPSPATASSSPSPSPALSRPESARGPASGRARTTKPVITLSSDHGTTTDVFRIYGKGWTNTKSCGGQVDIWIDSHISPFPGRPDADGRFITVYPYPSKPYIAPGVHEITATCDNNESPAVKYTVAS